MRSCSRKTEADVDGYVRSLFLDGLPQGWSWGAARKFRGAGSGPCPAGPCVSRVFEWCHFVEFRGAELVLHDETALTAVEDPP